MYAIICWVLWTFSVEKKSKDGRNARLDMKMWGIWLELYVSKDLNLQRKLPAVIHTLTKIHKTDVCNFLRNIRVPDDYSSNLSRCADIANRKLTGLKSHDCHVYLQVLLPLVICDIVHQDVVNLIIELSIYFKAVCSKVLQPAQLLQLESDITVTLCKLEHIFSLSFLM